MRSGPRSISCGVSTVQWCLLPNTPHTHTSWLGSLLLARRPAQHTRTQQHAWRPRPQHASQDVCGLAWVQARGLLTGRHLPRTGYLRSSLNSGLYHPQWHLTEAARRAWNLPVWMGLCGQRSRGQRSVQKDPHFKAPANHHGGLVSPPLKGVGGTEQDGEAV